MIFLAPSGRLVAPLNPIVAPLVRAVISLWRQAGYWLDIAASFVCDDDPRSCRIKGPVVHHPRGACFLWAVLHYAVLD